MKAALPKTLAVVLTAVAALLATVAAFHFVSQIRLPLTDRHQILSFFTVEGLSPWTAYVQYAVLLALASCAALAILKLLPKRAMHQAASAKPLTLKDGALCVLLVMALLIWAVGRLPFCSYPLQFYHEGEWLGYLPTWMSGRHSLSDFFLLHGFGLNILPALLTTGNASQTCAIQMNREVLSLLSVPGVFLVLLALYRTQVTGTLKGLPLFVLAFMVCDGLLFLCYTDNYAHVPIRRVFSLFELALALFLLDSARGRHAKRVIASAWVAGLMVPIAFLWYLSDAAVGLVVIGLSLGFAAFLLRSFKPIVASVVGAACAGLGIVAAFDVNSLVATAEMIRHWSANGRSIWILHLPAWSAMHHFIIVNLVSQAIGLALLIHGALRYRTLDKFLNEYGVILLLLVQSFLFLRTPLEHGSDSYFGFAALTGFFLLLAVVARAFSSRTFSAPLQTGGVVIGTLLVVLQAHPSNALTHARELWQNRTRPDQERLSATAQETVSRLQPLLQSQECFFTLNSDATWYYLMNKPSCSRFHQAIYASPASAQADLVRDLEHHKPERVLFTTERVDFIGLDNGNALHLVHQYILENYQPDFKVGLNWVWRRRAEVRIEAGDALPLQSQSDNQSRYRFTLSGPRGQNAAPEDTVFVSVGPDRRFIAASPMADGDTWSIQVPVGFLQRQPWTFEVWLYQQSGGDFKFMGSIENLEAGLL